MISDQLPTCGCHQLSAGTKTISSPPSNACEVPSLPNEPPPECNNTALAQHRRYADRLCKVRAGAFVRLNIKATGLLCTVRVPVKEHNVVGARRSGCTAKVLPKVHVSLFTQQRNDPTACLKHRILAVSLLAKQQTAIQPQRVGNYRSATVRKTEFYNQPRAGKQLQMRTLLSRVPGWCNYCHTYIRHKPSPQPPSQEQVDTPRCLYVGKDLGGDDRSHRPNGAANNRSTT